MNIYCFLLKFQITGFCNSYTSCWFNIIFILIVPLAAESWFVWVGDFYPKFCKTTEVKLLWHLSYFGLLINSKALLYNGLSEAFLAGKPLKLFLIISCLKQALFSSDFFNLNAFLHQ